MNEESEVVVAFNERAINALHTAVNLTLQKWTGQGDVDQEELFKLKLFFQQTKLEIQLNKQFGD